MVLDSIGNFCFNNKKVSQLILNLITGLPAYHVSLIVAMDWIVYVLKNNFFYLN
jgi:hypothetical protein